MSGKFGSADLVANSDTLLHTVPVDKVATVSVRFANRNTFPVRVSLAVGSTMAPETKDYVTYELELGPNGIHEDSGIPMSAGEKVWARSDTSNVSVRASGFEE